MTHLGGGLGLNVPAHESDGMGMRVGLLVDVRSRVCSSLPWIDLACSPLPCSCSFALICSHGVSDEYSRYVQYFRKYTVSAAGLELDTPFVAMLGRRRMG